MCSVVYVYRSSTIRILSRIVITILIIPRDSIQFTKERFQLLRQNKKWRKKKGKKNVCCIVLCYVVSPEPLFSPFPSASLFLSYYNLCSTLHSFSTFHFHVQQTFGFTSSGAEKKNEERWERRGRPIFFFKPLLK